MAVLTKDEEKEIWKADWWKTEEKFSPQTFEIRSRV